MNYIKFYKKETNKDYNTREYSIHHIDEDRENNSIENLVMLPKRLHNKYHFLKNCSGGNTLTINPKIVSILESGCGYNTFAINAMEKFLKCWQECNEWCDYKHYLLGEIPNIHHLTTEE